MKLTKAMTPTRHPQSIYDCKITYLIFFAIFGIKNLGLVDVLRLQNHQEVFI